MPRQHRGDTQSFRVEQTPTAFDKGQHVDATCCDRCCRHCVAISGCPAEQLSDSSDSKMTCDTASDYSTWQYFAGSSSEYAKADLSNYAVRSASRLEPIVSNASAHMMQASVPDIMLTGSDGVSTDHFQHQLDCTDTLQPCTH